MQSHWTRRYWFAGCLIALLFAAGCYQPAGANLEATNAAQSMPTFTPIPTETPIPTATPTEGIRTGIATLEGILPIASDTPDPLALLQGTSVAMLPDQQGEIDDLIATATAMAQQGQAPVEQPQDLQPFQAETIDPLALTATHIVEQATLAAGGQPTQMPGATIAPLPSATVQGATPVPSGSCVHTVVAGQNLFRISLQYNTTVDVLAAANSIVNPAMIFVGQQITIPGCGTSIPPVDGGSSSGSSGVVHTVQQGETLFEISLQYGVTVHALAARNGIANINLILIGQQITIP